jgi:hypothetical protein
VKTFTISIPSDMGYEDYINSHFREFVRRAGGGSRVVRCHPSVVPLFQVIGIRPSVDEDMRHGEATVAGSSIFVDNLQ